MEGDGIATQQPPAQTASAPSHEQLIQQLTAPTTADGGTAASNGLFGQLSANPFFAGGFALAALGVAASVGQRGIVRLSSLLRTRLLVDVEITRKDDSYQSFLQWMSAYTREQMAARQETKGGSITARLLRRFTPGIHHLSMQTTKTTLANGAHHTHYALVPGPGRHILRYRNAFIAVQRNREGQVVDITTGAPFETVTLTTLYAHRHIFPQLFQEAHALAARAEEGKTTIFMAENLSWRPFGNPKRKRPLDSVVLEDGVKERIVGDVRAFLKARNWYLDRGIPYRRGYLLYGPPGTGKSSFIQALAGELDFSIAMLNLSQRGLTDDRLNVLLTNVPPRTLVLLEDADAAFANRATTAADGYQGAAVSFSGLLNALDGVASAEERIIFLTTNHVDRMDPALVRPGRVDMTVRLGPASPSQAAQLWTRFYADVDADAALARAFVAELRRRGLLGRVSTSALQGLFLLHKGDPRGALAGLQELAAPAPGAAEPQHAQQSAP